MKLKHIFTTILCALASVTVKAQNCPMPISIVLDENFSNVPAAANTMLYQSLLRIVTQNGLSTDAPNSPFVLTAHCDVLDKSNLPGPPVQTTYNLGITLYMVDITRQTKFATAYFELNGVGQGEVKSYINAFKRLQPQNGKITQLIETGKSKMIEYYNTQYHAIIKEARRLEQLKQYEAALAQVLSIPVCTRGGDEATKYAMQLYTKQLNRFNTYLLNQAKTIWAVGQNQQNALKACELLAQIDPESAAYSEAAKLMAEIKKQIRADIDFEMRDKYNNQIDLEKRRIEAARAVGVAFGNGQQPQTTNLNWLR